MRRVIAILAVVAALSAATGCTRLAVKDVDQGKIDRMMDTLQEEDPK